jgi:hypothetical protein
MNVAWEVAVSVVGADVDWAGAVLPTASTAAASSVFRAIMGRSFQDNGSQTGNRRLRGPVDPIYQLG